MVRLGVVVGVVMASTSCAIETCVPGQTSACACTDGRVGAQVCRSNGTFDPCLCTGVPDGGEVDAGPDCRFFQPPRIQWSSTIRGPARIAPGQTLQLEADIFNSTPQTVTTWSVLVADGGSGSAPNTSVTPLRKGVARVQIPDPGSYVIELRATEPCGEAIQSWPVEVVSATSVPFIISDLACCDAQGRSFVIRPQRAEVIRLTIDGAIDSTQALPRVPSNLFLDAPGTHLLVGQDAFVSFFKLEDFSRTAEWAVPYVVATAISNGTTAWIYGPSSLALAMSVDSGVVLTQSTNAPTADRGFLSADGRRIIIDERGSLESLPLAQALQRTFTSSSPSTCGQLWAMQGRTRFITGCGEALEVRADGGFGYLGTVRAMTRFAAMAEMPDGGLAAAWFDQQSGEWRLRFLNGTSFGVQSEVSVGLRTNDLERLMGPTFLIPDSTGRLHTATPDPDNGVTWWQEF